MTIKSFSLYDLIPDLTSYLTYEGSLTIPGCYETVTWIIINKPVFITRQQVSRPFAFTPFRCLLTTGFSFFSRRSCSP